MKKNGFTLIELLAVIVILAIIFSITVITVGRTINDSEKSLSKTQKDIIEHAAETFYLQEGRSKKIRCVSLETLIERGYLKGNQVKDPKTKEPLNGVVNIKVNGSKYLYNYSEEGCPICTGVTTSVLGNVPEGNYAKGDEYTCKVNDTTTHNFYILNTEGDKVNLIMDRNLCSDGTEATASNLCIVYWMIKDDYLAAGGEEDKWSKYPCTKGPITALKYLDEATSSWTNIPNLNETYTDENTSQDWNYGTISLTGKARMIKSSEIDTFLNAKYLFNYLRNNPSANFSNTIDGIYGYWSLSSTNWYGQTLYYMGGSNYSNVDSNGYGYYGVRPVITLSKSDLG